jgi:hypothetical protein
MTTTLTGQSLNSTYKDLLQLGNSGAGITGSLTTVYDGNGAATGLTLSSSGIGTSGSFAASSLTVGGYSLTLGGTFSTADAFSTIGGSLAITLSGATAITFPTSGTLVTTSGTQTLTNKTLTTPIIAQISNTGTLTLPTSTDTLVARGTTDTLTNKTLTTPVIAQIVNTGTLTLPTSTDTLVARNTTDTLTNKTLTTPVIAQIVNTGTLTLPTATDTLVARTTTDTLTNKTLTDPKINAIKDTNGAGSIDITATASAVNRFVATNTATGNGPLLTVDGTDTNTDIRLRSKGTGQALIQSANTTTAVGFSTGTSYQHTTLLSFANTSASRTITIPDCDIPGMYVQQAYTSTGTGASGTTTIPFDNTIPQNTEGNQYMTLAITPKSTSNLLEIDVVVLCTSNGATQLTAALFQDSTADALAAMSMYADSSGVMRTITFKHRMTAGTTSSTTFKVRMGPSTAVTAYFSQAAGAAIFNGAVVSSIHIKEYSA